MAAGSFMPWAQAGIFSVSGTDGDGAFTFIGAAACGALFSLWGLWAVRSWMVLFLTAGLGALILLVVIIDGADIQRLAGDDTDFLAVKVGTGIYVTGVGGVGIILASFLGVRR